MSYDLSPIVASSNKLNFSLYTEITNKHPSENIIFSSYGLFTILTLLQVASTGKSKDELTTCLALQNISDSDINIAFKELFLKITTKENSSSFQSYNSIWITTAGTIRKEYSTIGKEFFFTEIYKINMQKEIKKIEAWINKRSHNKFADINLNKLLGDLAELITINLTYFKDNWFDQFDPKYTINDEFTLLTGEKIQVPMMRRTGAYGLASFNEFQVIDLPYESTTIMRIILPTEQVTLSQAFMTFKKAMSDHTFQKTHLESIFLKIPKFSFKFNINFKSILSNLGVEHIFQPNTVEISILEQKHINIDGIAQFSFIQNNERGTVAGSVTLNFYLGGGYPHPPQIFITRPFIFLILDTETNLILYTGVVLNPLST